MVHNFHCVMTLIILTFLFFFKNFIFSSYMQGFTKSPFPNDFYQVEIIDCKLFNLPFFLLFLLFFLFPFLFLFLFLFLFSLSLSLSLSLPLSVTMELTEEWRTDRFGCCSGDWSCCSIFMACCCYPCSIANAVTGSVEVPSGCDCLFLCCCYQSFTPASYTHFRKQYKIRGTECCGSMVCCDCLYACCCPLCMSCQIQNQSKERNFAPHTPNRNSTEMPWSQSFCDFTHDCCGCLWGCFCSRCAFAQVASQFAGTPCCYECFCGNPCLVRYNMHHHWNIEGPCCSACSCCGICGDFCALCCFPGCSYVQMKTEVELKGPMYAEEDPECCCNCCSNPI